MRDIRVEKITLNFGAGHDQKKLERGIKLIKSIAGISPVKTITNKRLAAWGLRPGLPIGCKLTLRKQKATALLKRLLQAKNNTLQQEQFDRNGNVAFGIHEHIDIPDAQYDPELGVMGFEVCITFERPGFRIKRRLLQKKSLPLKHRLTKEETLKFMIEKFNVKIGGEEQ